METERLSMAALLGENRERAPLLGNPKDIYRKALKTGNCRRMGTVKELVGG